MPKLHAFARSLATRALQHVSDTSLESAEATRGMLSLLGAVRLPYQQVRSEICLDSVYRMQLHISLLHLPSVCATGLSYHSPSSIYSVQCCSAVVTWLL